MAKIKFRIERCKGCGLCVPVCPNDNIQMSGGINKLGHKYAKVIDEDKCTGCGLCCLMCPDVSIELAGEEKETAKTKADVGTGGSQV
jgi:2-oxoglutarate ferredoxin oxidoreductase subunit delta